MRLPSDILAPFKRTTGGGLGGISRATGWLHDICESLCFFFSFCKGHATHHLTWSTIILNYHVVCSRNTNHLTFHVVLTRVNILKSFSPWNPSPPASQVWTTRVLFGGYFQSVRTGGVLFVVNFHKKSTEKWVKLIGGRRRKTLQYSNPSAIQRTLIWTWLNHTC